MKPKRKYTKRSTTSKAVEREKETEQSCDSNSESENPDNSGDSDSEVEKKTSSKTTKNFKESVNKYNTILKQQGVDSKQYTTPDYVNLKNITLDKNWSLRIVQAGKDYFIDIRNYNDKRAYSKGAFIPVKLYHNLVSNLIDLSTAFEKLKIDVHDK